MRNLCQISLHSCNFQSNSSPLQVESVDSSTNLPLQYHLVYITKLAVNPIPSVGTNESPWASNCGIHEYEAPQN
jgi:hypothetical protein